MAKKPTITTISSGYYSRTALNDNFTNIRDKFDNTLSLDGSTPNTMSADLDLGTNDILNAGTINTDVIKVGGVSVVDATYVPDWKGPWVTATSYVVNDLVSESGNSYICLVAHTSGTFSTDLSSAYWEVFAAKGAAGAGTGDMLAANNLSDVANAATSRSNLGLGSIATQANTAVNIDGGNIDGTVIGAATPAAGTFTDITAAGSITMGVYALSGTTPAFDPANGNVQTWTLTGASSPTDSMTSGEHITLLVDDGTAYTITWPTMKWVNNGGVAPTLATTGYTHIYLYKVGSVLYGSLLGETS